MASSPFVASRRAALVAAVAGLCTWLAMPTPVHADDVMEARHTMEEAAISVDRLREETKKSGEMDSLLKESKAVLIIPSFYKAGFIIGGAYGDGVLLAHMPDGSFSDPAFYRMTAGSLGLQIGMQSSEAIFVIRTEKGLSAVLHDEFKMGANAGIAIGSIGAGAEAATTTHVGQDIVSYSKASGLFVGGSFEGAVIKPRKDWNAAVYGVDKDDPRAILQRNGLRAATNLKDVLAAAVGTQASAAPVNGAGSESGDANVNSGVSAAPPVPAVNSSPVQPESQGQ
jgi:lipid-binding SYLF domain-containing protein